MPDPATTPIEAQLAEVIREITLRQALYPVRVSQGRMTRSAAERQISAMEAVRDTLRRFAAFADHRTQLLAASAAMVMAEADTAGRLPGEPDGPECEPWPELDRLRAALDAAWPGWREDWRG